MSVLQPPSAQDLHRLVLEDLTETVCRFRPGGGFTYVNEVFCRFFGKTEEQLLGKSWQPMPVSDDLPMIQEKLRLLTRLNPVVMIENRVYDGAGQVRWMQFVNRGFFDATGQLVEIQAVGRDITDRVSAEEKLRHSQQSWRFALESSGFGVWDWDVEHDEVFLSLQWRQVLGYPPQDEMPGNYAGWQTLLHPDDQPGVDFLVQDHLQGLTESFTSEFRLRCQDGSWKWVKCRGRVTERNRLGQSSRMSGIIADISRQKEAEEREARTLRLVAEGAPSEAVLAAITRNVEAAHPGMRCSVMLVDGCGARLRLKTAPRLPDFAREAIDGLPIGADSACCGAAAHSGRRTVCVDVLADARMEPFFKVASKARLRACWSQPIISSRGKVLGTLACYHSVPHQPSEREIQCVCTAANLAALALEREEKEHALAVSEERLARALRGATDGVWDWNITSGEFYLSTRWKEMLGYAENELPNSRESLFLARLHPEDVPKVRAIRQAHFEKRVPYQLEFRLMTKSGEFRWFLARGQAEWDENGEPVRMTGTLSDIEARKRAEQALEESEQRYRRIVETAEEGIWMVDTETRTTFANAKMASMLGYRVEEMMGKALACFMDAEARAVAEENMKRRQSGIAEQHEFRFQRKDGSGIWTWLSTSPIYDEGGVYTGALAMVTDISERKRAELNYRRELAYNQALVDHTSAFIMVLDKEGRFMHGNAAFFQVMGYEPGDLAGRTPWEAGLVEAREIERSRQRFERLLRDEDNPPADMRLRTKDGQWRSVEVRSTSTRSPDGSPDRIIITATDVTERNRLQREVLRIIELEQSRVGHDLHDGVGQSLTGILIMMEALEAGLRGGEQEHARRIHELVKESVAEVRRMSHGLSPTSVKYRGLDGALNLLAETVRTNFRTPCVCELGAGDCTLSEEKRAHLFRIAQEAVNNALRHGRPRSIHLSLKKISATECELRIQDDGRGMRKKRAKLDGGIGMRVMEYRANLIGGMLKVESKARHGVTVVCRVECDEEKAARKAPVAKKSAPRRRKS